MVLHSRLRASNRDSHRRGQVLLVVFSTAAGAAIAVSSRKLRRHTEAPRTWQTAMAGTDRGDDDEPVDDDAIVLPPSADPEAPLPDALDQALPVEPTPGRARITSDPEAPEADAIDQATI